MSQVPHLPDPGNYAPRHRDLSRWIDLIAFLAILCLGGALLALGYASAGSLTAICAALFAAWKQLGSSRHELPPDDPSGQGGIDPD
jgi:hypothetical protein